MGSTRWSGVARRVAAGAVVAAVALGGTSAAPALAHKADRTEHQAAKAARTAAAGEKKAAARQRKADARAARKTRFVVVGRATAVGADSITLRVKGGNRKALRGQEATVKVPADAKVTRGDERSALSSVVVGDHVAVKGKKVGDELVASAVHAEPAEVKPAG